VPFEMNGYRVTLATVSICEVKDGASTLESEDRPTAPSFSRMEMLDAGPIPFDCDPEAKCEGKSLALSSRAEIFTRVMHWGSLGYLSLTRPLW
jgi:hypothetical protein